MLSDDDDGGLQPLAKDWVVRMFSEARPQIRITPGASFTHRLLWNTSMWLRLRSSSWFYWRLTNNFMVLYHHHVDQDCQVNVKILLHCSSTSTWLLSFYSGISTVVSKLSYVYKYKHTYVGPISDSSIGVSRIICKSKYSWIPVTFLRFVTKHRWCSKNKKTDLFPNRSKNMFWMLFSYLCLLRNVFQFNSKILY